MAENVYEGMFLLDSGRYGREPDVISGQIAGMIEEAGGTVLVSRLWEERRLAYPLKGYRKGTYWLTYFRVDGTALTDIRRKCQLKDSILRVLFVKVDPRIVDTLVQHALAGGTRPVSDRRPGRPPKGPPAAPAGKTDEAPAGKTDEAPAGKTDEAPAGKTDEAAAGKTDEAAAGKTDEAAAATVAGDSQTPPEAPEAETEK